VKIKISTISILLLICYTAVAADENAVKQYPQCDGVDRKGVIHQAKIDGVISGFPEKKCVLRAQNAEGRAQNAEGRAQNAEGRAQNAEGRAQNAEGRAQNAKLDEEIAKLDEENAKLDEEIARLKEKIKNNVEQLKKDALKKAK
jgi:peptidoglycan hydrolase CwlO-like protein